MHAGWNVIAKLDEDRLVAIALIKVPNTLLAAAVLALVPMPAPQSWPFIAVSAAVSLLYFYFLINAYRTGDLSLAYPIARGIGPMLVLLLSWGAVGETPTIASVVGVTLLGLTLVALGLQREEASPRHREAILWAVGVGTTIALYTVADGVGGRLSASPVGYVAALNILTGIVLAGFTFQRRGGAFIQALRSRWPGACLGGAMMMASYIIVVYAMTLAPMAYVAALRESSIVFAAIMGAVVLREPFGAKRIIASLGVVAAIAILMLSPMT